jgi:hypothetical protein
MPNINYTTQLSSTDNYGSITYLKLPNNNGFSGIVPFKYNIPPYGNWPNTTECNIGGDPNKQQCPITQTTYSDGTTLPNELSELKWKCSEVAYHAQKLLDYRQKLATTNPADLATINYLDQWIRYMQQLPILPDKIFLPRDHWDPILKQIAQNLGEYDYTNNNYYSFNNKLKAGPNAKENYNRMKFVVGLKVEQHKDLMEQAKFFAEQQLIPIECSKYDKTWASGIDGNGENLLGRIIFELGEKELKTAPNPLKPPKKVSVKYNALKQKLSNQLTHDALINTASPPENMFFNSIPYSSEGPKGTSKPQKKDTTTTTIPNVNAEQAKEQIKQAIITKLSNKTPTKLELIVANDQDTTKPTQKVLKVTFGTKDEANDFAEKVQAQNTENNGLTVILGQEKIKFFFNEHNLNTHLITILSQEEQKISVKSNRTAKERVLDKIPNASNVSVTDDKTNPGNKSLTVSFDNQQDANNFQFAKDNNITVQQSEDSYIFILNQTQAEQFFTSEKYGKKIDVHGKTAKIPMIQALQYEQSCNAIENCFNFKKYSGTDNALKDIEYKKLWDAPVAEKAAQNTQDTIGKICSTDLDSKDLAIIKENSIECPTDATNNLTPTQNEIFITFLEMHNNKNITIEANNFSPTDLTALLDLLSKKEPKINVKLELPEQDKCVYGNNEKYTETEYNDIKAKIDLFNNKTPKNQSPKP